MLIATAMACSRNPSRDSQERLIFRDANGRELSTKDLRGVSGKANYEVVGVRDVPDAAMRLHEAGRRAGAAGRYDDALTALAQAHELAPTWPYPLYDTAWTYLLIGDATRAEEKYSEVDKLAPRGFFTTKTALDCLRRERKGEIGPGAYKVFVLLESRSASEKKEVLNALLKKWPRFPAAWKELSTLLDDDVGQLAAIEKGLAYDPDGETQGILLLNKALALNRQGKKNEAVAMLGTLALDPQSTLGTETLAKFTLLQITSGK